MDTSPIHEEQRTHTAGAPAQEARAAMVMIHGRGATAPSILTLAQELPQEGFAFLAPQAARNTWYPNSFLAPLQQNEPHLTSALTTVGALLEEIAAAGVPAERTILLGFSQGGCLATEYAARNAQRFGGVVALSGGLIGPPGTPRDYGGSLQGTPVFLGCSDVDPHIPKERVEESARVLQEMGATVTKRLYPGMGHTVNRDEIDFVRELMAELLKEQA